MVGINNYLRVFTDNEAISSIGRTFGISLIVVPLSICICLLLSLLLYANIKGIGVFRTIYYLPSIIPSIAVVTMWKGMFVKEGGLLNMVSSFENWLGLISEEGTYNHSSLGCRQRHSNESCRHESGSERFI